MRSGIGITVVVLALIGFRVFGSIPRYETIHEDHATIPPDQGQFYGFELLEDATLRINASTQNGSAFTLYWLSASDYRKMDSQDPEVFAEALAKAEENTLVASDNKIVDLETPLERGDYFVIFEPADLEATEPMQLHCKLEAK